MAPSSSQASSAEGSEDALARALSGLVISVSGRIPGKNHDQIKRMVEKCGAKYEDQDIGDCTHLIMTSNSMKTVKVREARGRKGCEIVSIDWLIASMEELKPMRADDFKVGKPTLIKANFDPEFLGQKRKLDTEFEREHGSFKKPRNKPPAGFEKGLAIVDRENTKMMVWIDEKGVWWDAILAKVSQVIKGSPMMFQPRIFHTSTYRIQLLFDVEQKTYFIDVREDQGYYRTGKSSLETAQTEFRRAFREASGLRVERAGELNRLAQWTEDNNEKAGERRLLWHGSTVRNFVGILSQGLHLDVYRDKTDFGIFFADMAGKSATYCRALPGEAALMLLCEVELGHTMLPWNTERRKGKASDGCAVFIEGCKYHSKWHDAQCVHRDLAGIMMPDLSAGTTYLKGTGPRYGHNEYVVHDPAQIRQRYLFQIKFN